MSEQPSGLPPFHVLVKTLREQAHLTQGDLAAFMGLSANGGRETIAYWETGARRPTEAQMPKLAACLSYWPIAGDPTIRHQIVEAALVASCTYPEDEADRD